MRSSARRLPWLVGTAFALASAVYLVTEFEWKAAVAVLWGADPAWLFGVSGATIVAFVHLRTVRWRALLSQSGVLVPYRKLYLTTAVTVGLAIAMPFQSGELAKVELLRRMDRIARLPGYATLLVERFLDLVCVAALGALSLLGRVGLTLEQRRLLLTGLLVLAAVGGVLSALILSRSSGLLRQLQEAMRLCLGSRRVVLSASITTVLGWLMVAAGWYAALRSIGAAPGPLSTLALTSIVTLINVASLVPGAVGVAEASTALMLRSFDTAPAIASAGALAIRTYGLLIVAIGLLHLPIWMRLARRRTG